MTSILEEKDAIRDVLSAYCFYTDSGEHDKRANLFVEDAIFETPLGTSKGRKTIEKFVASIFPPGGRPARKHCVMNSIITVDGAKAEAQSYLIIVRETTDGPRIAFGGRYLDKLVKQQGKWMFQHRIIVGDLHPNETGKSVFS